MNAALRLALVALLVSLPSPATVRAQSPAAASPAVASSTSQTAAAATASSTAAPQAAPSPAAAPPAASSAGEDGFTGAVPGTFAGDTPLLGGMLTAHVGVIRFLVVDVGFEHALSLDDALDVRETGITLGLRLIPNPRARFRFVLPVRVGGLIRAEHDAALGSQDRAVELTVDAGAGLTLRLLGPLALSALGRGQARRTPGGDGVDWVAKADVGLTFLF